VPKRPQTEQAAATCVSRIHRLPPWASEEERTPADSNFVGLARRRTPRSSCGGADPFATLAAFARGCEGEALRGRTVSVFFAAGSVVDSRTDSRLPLFVNVLLLVVTGGLAAFKT
jgi:hypothetical protein